MEDEFYDKGEFYKMNEELKESKKENQTGGLFSFRKQNQKEIEEYTEEEKVKFEKYLEGQIAKIDLPNKDIPFLRNKILTMYANPLINYLEAAKG